MSMSLCSLFRSWFWISGFPRKVTISLEVIFVVFADHWIKSPAWNRSYISHGLIADNWGALVFRLLSSLWSCCKLGRTNLPGSLSSLYALICRLLSSCFILCLYFHQVVCLLSSVVQIWIFTRIFVFGWSNWFWIFACSFSVVQIRTISRLFLFSRDLIGSSSLWIFCLHPRVWQGSFTFSPVPLRQSRGGLLCFVGFGH